MSTPARSRRAALLGGLSALALTASLVSPTPVASAVPEQAADQTYRGSVQVVPGKNPKSRVLKGTVYVDADRDSVKDADEKGIRGVAVSNGRDVVTTDRNGNYTLRVDDNTTVFITQPAGYQVPVDEANVAQFFYNHMPQGSPKLKFGGIKPTGPLPKAVNFGLVESPATASGEQDCIIGGDIQTYKKKEAEYAAKGAFTDLAARDDYRGCGALFIGDIVGDDLSLYPGIRELTSKLNGPARFLPGNHDLDFDAKSRSHAFDTFRNNFGPTYHSYDVGRAHVISLDTVQYPAVGRNYNGALGKQQIEWLKKDLARVPKNKLIVVAGHIPLLTYADQGSEQHQIDEVAQVYKLLKGRKAVAVSGHTHSIENMVKGDSLAGWEDIFGVAGLPFHHITSGAISGDWYSGRLLEGGYPVAVQRDGGLPGVVTLDIKGNRYTERFTVRGDKGGDQMALGLNTPAYREWYRKSRPAKGKPKPGNAAAMADPLKVSKADLSGSWLTTNFFMGSTGSTVKVSIDGGRAQTAVRTQPMTGEGQYVGPEYSDPSAVQEQLVNGGSLADRSMHLWRQSLPTDLEVGKHTATVRATDRHGRVSTEKITFEVTE
ncbi:calcineurin-like phosphoesterase C-terminal domain-containing protein [Luteococcus sp. Sow4_B9]|uniref:calcineurin-like phosphoesterase C-terminal domain-containing protein n=1 Tax=Luteococcus sp. Sow4_B9 TaxID=3438792 RepID=UPI003F95FF6F